jgi:hypothetical protein
MCYLGPPRYVLPENVAKHNVLACVCLRVTIVCAHELQGWCATQALVLPWLATFRVAGEGELEV